MATETAGRWSEERAWAWARGEPWLVGANFIPSTASNQLEMWQAETFDPETIDRELGWAAAIGMNSARVYLHDLVWRSDAHGFLSRVDRFLDLAHGRGIATMLVLFDSVWNPSPRAGPQPSPRPRTHNAGWVQSPGAAVLADRTRHDELEGYVTAVVARFATDERVVAWDLMNEPDNPYLPDELQTPEEKAANALALLEKTFRWARVARPRQPLTSGVWQGSWADPGALSEMSRFQLAQSDVVSFHCYGDAEEMRARIRDLERYGRPLVCTEFMARTQKSTFEAILPVLAEKRVGALCWGLVAGRTQTIYPWDSWAKTYDAEPEPWFHDVFHADGRPYAEGEVEVIRRLTHER